MTQLPPMTNNQISNFTPPYCEDFSRNNRSRLRRDKKGGMKKICNNSQRVGGAHYSWASLMRMFIPVEITKTRDHMITKNQNN